MKFCAKCTCAQYCSSKWKKVHRASCHQILWLRHAVFYFEQLEASDEDVTFPSVKLEASENSDEGVAFYFVR